MTITKRYKAEGVVLGHLWGGGEGSYKATSITANTQEELLAKANEMLENGSLDGGMGFESLLGAFLIITTTKFIMYKGEDYSREEQETELLGDLDEKQQDFLQDTYYKSL